MLHIGNDGTIELTRGDTARLTVSITNDSTDAPYEIRASDVLKLTLKKSVNDTEPCMQKIATGSGSFHIEPEDTAGLAFGDYKYDVELTTAEGDVYTVIEPNTFKIMAEVSS